MDKKEIDIIGGQISSSRDDIYLAGDGIVRGEFIDSYASTSRYVKSKSGKKVSVNKKNVKKKSIKPFIIGAASAMLIGTAFVGVVCDNGQQMLASEVYSAIQESGYGVTGSSGIYVVGQGELDYWSVDELPNYVENDLSNVVNSLDLSSSEKYSGLKVVLGDKLASELIGEKVSFGEEIGACIKNSEYVKDSSIVKGMTR